MIVRSAPRPRAIPASRITLGRACAAGVKSGSSMSIAYSGRRLTTSSGVNKTTTACAASNAASRISPTYGDPCPVNSLARDHSLDLIRLSAESRTLPGERPNYVREPRRRSSSGPHPAQPSSSASHALFNPRTVTASGRTLLGLATGSARRSACPVGDRRPNRQPAPVAAAVSLAPFGVTGGSNLQRRLRRQDALEPVRSTDVRFGERVDCSFDRRSSTPPAALRAAMPSLRDALRHP